MTTEEADKAQGKLSTSWLHGDFEFYFSCAVVFIGVVGTAGNGLVLYALVASKQHKKHMLIVNQNVMDLFSSFFLIICYALKLCNLRLTGASGYWLCITLLSEGLIWVTSNGAVINLAVITVDRYLKVVHPIWSRKMLRPWMIYSAAAFSWLVGAVFNIPTLFKSSAVVDGVCYSYIFFDSLVARRVSMVFLIFVFYVIILVIFIFCYGSILATIRRQARVMAGHNATGSSTTQTQIQSSVIKTMILVCVFYAITQLPNYMYMLAVAVDFNIKVFDGAYYASVFLVFIYTCTNPFIYAIKFDPVRQTLRAMVVCKKTSVQPQTAGTARS